MAARVTAKLTGSILTLAGRLRGEGRGAALAALRREVVEVVEAARARWPVDTGRSRRELTVVDVPPQRVAAEGRAPYTIFIVSRGVRPWREYVLLPLQRRLSSRDTHRRMWAAVSAAVRRR